MRVAQEGDALVLRWREAFGSHDQLLWGDTESKILVENLEQFEVSYRREFGANWQTEWIAKAVPGTVRMQLKSRGRYWPELILRVQQ